MQVTCPMDTKLASRTGNDNTNLKFSEGQICSAISFNVGRFHTLFCVHCINGCRDILRLCAGGVAAAGSAIYCLYASPSPETFMILSVSFMV